MVQRLRQHGYVAYFAGGCVRDMLLGIAPKDYDVATDAPPQRVREIFSNTQAVGAAFGVILVRHGKSTVEVATFRSDARYEDGRRPTSVTFTTPEEDAKRRDFTINGLFFDPIDETVIDYIGGQQDLRDRVLRAIGNPNERFEEDHLRLMRAVRFAARFTLKIEPATHWAIGHHADVLRRISPERIAEELRLMLAPASRNIAWPMLWEYGLLHVILRMLPGLPKTKPMFDPQRSILLALLPGESASFATALAAGVLCYQWQITGGDLLPLLQKQQVQKVVHSVRLTLKISNSEMDEMSEVLHSPAVLLGAAEPGVAQMKRFLAGAHAGGARQILTALRTVGLHPSRCDWLANQLDELSKGDYAPIPFVTGDDLTAAGYRPGPVFKPVLEQVYDAQLEDRVKTKQQAIALARTILDNGAGSA
ncbi:MAG TPA: CCA tRNA nucleotidyltransferase [Tepidisphaeraceae bacterium]